MNPLGATRSPRYPGPCRLVEEAKSSASEGETDVEDLKKRIQWLQWLLDDPERFRLTEDTIRDQEQRLNQLQDALQRKTTCHCGEGVEFIEHGLELIKCVCNKQDFVISNSRL